MLRRHGDASSQVVFYVHRAILKNSNRAFNKTLQQPSPAKLTLSTTIRCSKKTLQNNKPLREPKNSIPTAVPHPHHKVYRPKELWSERRGSNSRHPPWEGGALPSELRSPNRPYLMGKPKKRQYRFLTLHITMEIPFVPNVPKNML